MSITTNRYGVYKLRLRVHKDLLPYFNKREINKSLKTKNYKEAQRLSGIIEHKYKEILKVVRLLDSKEIASIINKFIVEELEQDIIDRAETGQGLVKTSVDKEDPMYDTASFASATTASLIRSDYMEELAEGNYARVYQEVDDKLKEANLVIAKDSQDYKKLCYYMMQAQIALLKEVEHRGYLGQPNNPEKIARTVTKTLIGKSNKTTHRQKKGTLLSEAIQRYLTVYKRKEITEHKKKECETVLNKVLCMLNDVQINDLEDVDLLDLQDTFFTLPRMNQKPYNKMDFKDVIAMDLSEIPDEKKISKRTVSDHIDVTKQFFKYCFDNGIIDNNIGSQLGVVKPESTKVPFSNHELSSLIQVVKEEDDNKQLLLMPYFYTSFRREELYNSVVEDVDGVICFRITKGKNKFAKRIIPLSKQLLEYYANKRLDTATKINDALEEAKKSISYTSLGKYFNSVIKVKVVSDSRKTLHSTRKTFSTIMAQLKVNDSMIKVLTGHTPSDTLNKVYIGDRYSVHELKDAIDKIVF